MKNKVFLALASASVLSIATPALATSPAYEYTTAGSLSDSRPYTLGFSFSLSGPTTVYALGYNLVGFTSAQSIGLWTSGGTLLASTSVLPTDPVTGHFAYSAISPLALGAGDYVLGGTYTGGPFVSYLSGVTSAPGFTYGTDLQTYGAGLLFPTYSTSGAYGANGIAQVNFSTSAIGAVPETATWMMMIGGFGLIGVGMRGRAAARVKVAYA